MRKGLFSIMCAALIAAASAAPSWSQVIGGGTGPQYAKELFGGGQNPELNLNGGTVTVAYDFSTTNLSAARSANITFTLSAGTFVDPPNALVYSPTAADMSIMTTSGGPGSNSITYAVRSVNTVAVNNATFTFTVPRITGVGSVLGAATPANPAVSIEVAVVPAVAGQPGGFPAFPAMTTTADGRKHTVATSGSAVALNAGDLTPPTGATSSVPVISLSDRTMTTGATAVTGLPVGSRTAATILSTIRLFRATAPVRADGTTQFLEDMNGNLVVTAEGSFSQGDILFFSTDTAYATSEALSVSGGTATLSLPLSHLNNGALDGMIRTLYYVAAQGMLRQATISVSYRFDFTLENNKYADRIENAGSTVLTFSGIQDVAYAYAIPNPESGDTANMRIRCQGEAACSVFLDCMDQNGVRVGNGNLAEATIPGNALMHYSSKTTLPTLLGTGSWNGRISCNVMSNRDISVQVLVRSGDTLVNNTYVSGLEPNPGP